MDNIYWKKNWSINPNFRELLQEQLKVSEWIICGNYSKVKDLTWAQANIIIWLDYPFYIVFWRALKRSIKRIYSCERVCGENIETLTRLLSKNSILWWIIKTYYKRKREYQVLIMKKIKTPKIIRITSSKQLDKIIYMINDALNKL